jgi:hypothetical protein
MCTYVDTGLSLPSLKYTVVAWLLTFLHLSTVPGTFNNCNFKKGEHNQSIIAEP